VFPNLSRVSKEPSKELAKPKILMSSVDITRVKAWEIAEKRKISAFARLRFFNKPKPDELKCTRFVKYYEPYLRISGSYSLDYYRKSTYAVPVNSEVAEVEVFNKKLTPQPEKEGSATKGLKIEATELVQFRNSATMILDRKGREIAKELPKVKMEEIHESFYHEHQHEILNVEILTEKAVDLLKKHITQRPKDIEKIKNETVNVNEITTLYFPFYYAEYIREPKNEARVLKINGCTGSVEILPITAAS